MKVAMIGSKGVPAVFGGVERHVHELSKRLEGHGVDVFVYSRKWYTKLEADTVIEGINVVHKPSIRNKYFDAISHVFVSTLHAMKQKDIDVLHYHGVGPALVAWIPRIFAKKKTVIITFHSIDRKHAKWNWFAKLVLRIGEWASCAFAHNTIAVSRTIQQYARDSYDCHATFIPNGVPLYEKAETTNHLGTWNLKPNSYLLMVSRLIEHKGMHYMIEAYNRLTEHNPELVKDYPLVIVGDGYYTDEYVASLHTQAKGNPNIIFTGFQSGEALSELFSNAHLMIHPSDNEGLPINVLEGMSYGLPILLSDIPEHMELITDQQFLFSWGNVDDLTVEVERIMRMPKEILEKSAQRNRNQIKQSFTWNIVSQNIVKLYEQESGKDSV